MDVRQLSIFASGALIAVCSIAACSNQVPATEPIPNCGWDTSVVKGQQALSQYLTSTDNWLKANPGATPPAPVSEYWMGDCPNDGTNVGPPIDEAGDSHSE
ncbi:MAG: hypothetical protein PHN51_00140 [Candidatus Nanopelagicales bacterium]|nr:hypothetical protein [Candidatus Nanopelagicales bacterium]